MLSILAGILSLVQHITTLQQTPERYLPARCPHCGKAGVWRHGDYLRKADRLQDGELNPILIPRFFCRFCLKTCSVLPECIPPHRWYLWEIQQAVFLLCLAGKSFYAVAQASMPSQQTIKRWLGRFQEKFREHRDALCHWFVKLGHTLDFVDFWQACLNKISLGSAMRLCHVAGVIIP